MKKRFKLEFVGLTADPIWFDDKEALDNMVKFIKACPVDDIPGGRAKLRITEYAPGKVKVI